MTASGPVDSCANPTVVCSVIKKKTTANNAPRTTQDKRASLCNGLLGAGGEELVRNAGYTARFVLSTAKHGVALMMRRHDDHGHIILSPSAQCLLDQVVTGTVGIAVCL